MGETIASRADERELASNSDMQGRIGGRIRRCTAVLEPANGPDGAAIFLYSSQSFNRLRLEKNERV